MIKRCVMADNISTVSYRKKQDHFRTKAILYCRVDGPENAFTMDMIQGQKNFLLSFPEPTTWMWNRYAQT